jgi:hypothetical protein
VERCLASAFAKPTARRVARPTVGTLLRRSKIFIAAKKNPVASKPEATGSGYLLFFTDYEWDER